MPQTEPMIFPLCEKCQRLVDTVTMEKDPLRMGSWITVQCHGEKERTFLSDRTLIDATSVGAGVAFIQKQLESR